MRDVIKPTRARLWLLIVGIATLIVGTAYTFAQQSTRLATNDLPLATAQTIQQELDSGAAPADVVPAVKTDLRSDSTIFATITDNSHKILASSATLNDQTTLPPVGVFDYTAAHGSDHFTWEPASGVRLATEVLSYSGSQGKGFIVTGQSLSQAENRINKFGLIALAGWLGVIAWTTLLLYLPLGSKADK